MGNLTYLQDLDAALGQIRAQTGLDKFELIGLDGNSHESYTPVRVQ